ncbi:MAG: DUF4255 domain-containing protein, partial [Anaerolineales bacterium]|nr:DUF4255 domain-containing protein [Anaerolineales bacterium]
TLEHLLLAQMPRKVNISFAQPTSGESSKFSQTTPTLNLFLFDIRENNVLRQHQWQAANSNGNGNGNGRSHKQRTPYRFDCHYLITAWAKTIDGQHQLLSEAMHILLQHPVLPDAALVGSLQKPQFPIQAKLGSHDKLTNPAELWSALENQIRAAVSYIVTIELNPWQPFAEEAPVVTKRLRLQQRAQLETAVETVEVAGYIRSESGLSENLTVTLTNDQRWHEAAITLERVQAEGEWSVPNGRYAINHVQPDRYTLTLWQQTEPGQRQKVTERQVIVPPPVHILSLANTFQMQIGKGPTFDGLHLSRRQAGFVGQLRLDQFAIEQIGQQMPRSGTYHFGKVIDEQSGQVGVTAVIPTTSPKIHSFQLAYKQPDDGIGEYDLTI